MALIYLITLQPNEMHHFPHISPPPSLPTKSANRVIGIYRSHLMHRALPMAPLVHHQRLGPSVAIHHQCHCPPLPPLDNDKDNNDNNDKDEDNDDDGDDKDDNNDNNNNDDDDNVNDDNNDNHDDDDNDDDNEDNDQD